jgi:pilus assembly protein Flp/PilA
MKMLQRFIASEDGATAVEYSLIATLISLGLFLGFGRFADALQWLWSDNNSRLFTVIVD